MSINYQCPACSRSLYYDAGGPTFQVCPICKSKIIVPSTVVHQSEMGSVGADRSTLEQQKTLKLAQIQSEMQAGRKIEAIKHFRDAFGSSLAEAKDAVEVMEHGGKINISNANLSRDQMNPAAKNLPGIPQRKELERSPQFNPRRAISTILFYIAIGLMLYYWFFD
ncbi:MAG: hypothetical protein HKN25_00210 [Pyrinomonadaceae bacterium]|nr:hypothetical protein [Pyrinomonadaceae bacterium]